jgi:hypothetical protein
MVQMMKQFYALSQVQVKILIMNGMLIKCILLLAMLDILVLGIKEQLLQPSCVNLFDKVTVYNYTRFIHWFLYCINPRYRYFQLYSVSEVCFIDYDIRLILTHVVT